MDSQKTNPRLFEITPTNSALKLPSGVFGKGRLLLGRTAECDLIVNHNSVSAIHAILEIADERAMLYDMNSTNGTYLNDVKIVAKEIHPGDFFRLADVEFEIHPYQDPSPPPFDLPTSTRPLPVSVAEVYTPAIDPSTEYVIEVIVVIDDKTFSIDHLSKSESKFYISSLASHPKLEPESAISKGNGQFLFIEIYGAYASVHHLPGFDFFQLIDKGGNSTISDKVVELASQDLVRLQKGNTQIYVKNVMAASPVVFAHALKKNKSHFDKYLFIFVVLVVLVSAGVLMYLKFGSK